MGAWGINTFENDGALDWLGEFMDDPSEPMLLSAFTTERTGGASIAPELDGETVLAAAEVVASLRGHPALTNPEELADLPPLHVHEDTASHALAAIDSILAGSNLKDCWEETNDHQQWLAAVEDIRARLTLPRIPG